MKIKVSKYVADRVGRSRDQFRVDTYRDSGKGGQHRNKTDSGVRIVDKVTGIMVECCDTRSQIENKEIAFVRLIHKLIAYYQKEEREVRVQPDPNQKAIRTYKGNQAIDHRTGKSYPLHEVLDGRLEEIVSDLQAWNELRCLTNL